MVDQLERDADDAEIDLKRYLLLVLKYKWLLIACVAVAVTGAVLYGQSRPILYQASASILIESQAPQVLGRQVEEAVDQGVNGWNGDRKAYYSSQLSIMGSHAVMQLAADKSGLIDNPAVAGTGSAAERQQNVVRALSAVKLHRAEDEEIVWITATHRDPDAAAATANALVVGYEHFAMNSYQAGNSAASEWLARELDRVEKDLEQRESEIFQFKKEHDLLSLSLEDRRNLLANQIEHYSQQASQAKTERIALEAELERIKKAAAQDISTSPIFEITGSRNGLTIRESFIAAVVEEQSLAANLGPQHPVLIKQKEMVAQLRSSLQTEAQLIAQAVEEKHQRALRFEQRLDAEVEELKTQAFALGPTEVAHNALVRKHQDAQERSQILRERFRSNELAARLQATNIQPLDAAVAPALPLPRRWGFYVTAAVAIGLLLGIGLIGLFTVLDSRVRTIREVEELCPKEFVGALPFCKTSANDPVASDPRFEEAMRIIRTNLGFLKPDLEARRILITSAQPRDGKSTTAYRLAQSFAQAGKKVVLVDADLRNSSVHDMLGIPRKDGLSDVIVGDIAVTDALRMDTPSLSILPAGRMNRYPAEALSSKRFQSILEELDSKFDVVIIDAPPILPVADATLLVSHADVTVVLARCGQTDKGAFGIALNQIRRARPECLAVVANSLDTRSERYIYAGYYSYGPANSEVVGEAAKA